ncbi:MAG: DUF4440 domain-containing protein [Terriglobales bacterium]
MKNILTRLLFVILVSMPIHASEPKRITHEELVRRTQELFDAVASGNQEPWKKYFADDSMYFDEKGRSLDKTALLKDLAPLPSGYSGSIKIAKAQSRIVGDTAILSYDLDEAETIFGQQLSARYHATDTWLFRNGKWRIIAGQVLRYYEDPSPGRVDPKMFDQYVGTYELAPGVTLRVSKEDDQLYTQRGERPREALVPEAAGIFFRKGIEGRRLFRLAQDGTVDALIDRRNNEDVIWKKTK